jgi:phosphoribosylaminoimidazolecarboxamide formyltransferase/IMP cyclohydrolase
VGEESTEVIRKMIEGDPLALFGGLVMTNFPIGEEEAELLHSHAVAGGRRILDGIIAPEFLPEAFELLKRKGDKCSFLSNLALYELGVGSLDQAPRFRYVRGGFLTQPNYSCLLNLEGVAMGEDDRYDMLLAHAVCQTSNSNTITLVKDRMLIGNGVGQQSRVGGANLAITRARDSGHDVTDAVASSDSYFPFTDGVETLVEAGVRTIQSTSGSVNDQKVIDYCQTEGILLHLVPDKEGRGFFGH